MKINRLWKFTPLLIAIFLLSACSDGSSSSEEPSSTTFSLSLDPIKNFQFSWSSVSDTTHYKLMENPDGVSGFTQVGADIPPGTLQKEHIVSLPKRINAQYILQSCNAQDCIDSATVSVAGTLVNSIGYLKASNTGASDRFGYSISLSGDGTTLAVGANTEDSNATGIDGDQTDNSAEDSGAVYLFTRTGTTWVQQAYFKASNSGGGDYFGTAVSLSNDGNTLAVGAPSEGSSATGINGIESDNAASSSGAAYLFTRSGTTWTQQTYLKASHGDEYDRFGGSVSLSADGNTLAVGAEYEDSSATGIDGSEADNSALWSGAVYLFSRTGTTWVQQAYIKASNTEESDRFGSTVSLSADGNTLAASAQYESGNATGVNGNEENGFVNQSGAVYLFSRSGTAWAQQAYLKASNTAVNDQFGSSISLSSDGNTLAVAARNEDSNATGIDGDQTDNSAEKSGAVYLFSRSGTVWHQQAYLKASNTEVYDTFGNSLSLSGDGNTLVVAAVAEDGNTTGIGGDQTDNAASWSGATYLFTRTGTTWAQQAYIKASNTEANDGFGLSASLSADGNTLAVGAPSEGSSATGVGGDQAENATSNSGAIYLY